MTVKELMVELEKWPPDEEVWIAEDSEGEYQISWVGKIVKAPDGSICLCP